MPRFRMVVDGFVESRYEAWFEEWEVPLDKGHGGVELGVANGTLGGRGSGGGDGGVGGRVAAGDGDQEAILGIGRDSSQEEDSTTGTVQNLNVL